MKEKLNKMIGGLITNLPFILVIAGIAAIVYAGFLFTEILGFVILGIALVVIAYIISPQQTQKR